MMERDQKEGITYFVKILKVVEETREFVVFDKTKEEADAIMKRGISMPYGFAYNGSNETQKEYEDRQKCLVWVDDDHSDEGSIITPSDDMASVFIYDDKENLLESNLTSVGKRDLAIKSIIDGKDFHDIYSYSKSKSLGDVRDHYEPVFDDLYDPNKRYI